MKLKTNRLLFILLIITGVVLNSCVGKTNQYVNLTPSPIIATSTPASATSTLTITPTLTPTNWYIAMLTMTPTAPALPTLPPSCGTVKLGRAGTQTVDHIQKILIQGTAILCGQIYVSDIGIKLTASILEGLIDLDTGTFNVENADFWFCPGGGSTIYYYLCHVNNTEIRKYRFLFENGKAIDPKQPSFEECLGTEPYTGINDDEAKYACVVTTLGNISRVKVEKFDPLDGVMSVKISFITWEK